MKKLDLVKRNTVEIIGDLGGVLKKKNPVVYLGTAITGRPHIAYFVWVRKMADFLKAGFKIKILLADLHGALDNCPWDVLEKRLDYYKKIIPLMFKSLGVNTKNLEFVKGSSFQLSKSYCLDVLKMSSFCSVRDCTKAASEVVKMGKNPKLSGLIYPIMQALDEEYLNADIQYGGLDQRKILVFNRENLSKVGYKSRVEIMTPIIPGLTSEKMSASDPKSKIDLLDDEKTVRSKIKNAYCVAGDKDNALLAFLEYVLMVDRKKNFVVKRPEKFGGDLCYKNYKSIEKDFVSKKLHPLDLKNAVADDINDLLRLFRKNFKVLNKFAKDAY